MRVSYIIKRIIIFLKLNKGGCKSFKKVLFKLFIFLKYSQILSCIQILSVLILFLILLCSESFKFIFYLKMFQNHKNY